ncbi:MAG: NAD(+) synthase [Patescibacteria group bacterium]|nr:NAD(+) synthase [Patescibacteria group bacterium]
MKIPKHLKIDKQRARKMIKDKVKEIRNYFKKSGFKKGVIGLSGGLDSALACYLAVRALEAKNVYVVMMPYYGISDKNSIIDALKLIENLKIPKKNILLLPVNKPVEASWQILKKYKGKEKIRKGNLMARERMKILFDLSQVFNAMVVGTEDRTEEELGYYTLWGDEASGIEPIRNLWKTQVSQLASHCKEIPKEILNKEPSPGLWKNHSAKNELGFSHLEADIVLSAFKDLKMKPIEINRKFEISKKKIDLILKRTEVGQIKKTIPYILKK